MGIDLEIRYDFSCIDGFVKSGYPPFVVRRIFASNVGTGRKCRIVARFPRDRTSLNSNGVIQLRRVGTGVDKSRDSTMRL